MDSDDPPIGFQGHYQPEHGANPGKGQQCVQTNFSNINVEVNCRNSNGTPFQHNTPTGRPGSNVGLFKGKGVSIFVTTG